MREDESRKTRHIRSSDNDPTQSYSKSREEFES